MVFITIVAGAYKPTYNWGASHCSYVWISISIYVGILPTSKHQYQYQHEYIYIYTYGTING